MPTIRVELFEGRPPQRKSELANEPHQACVNVLGGPADGVDVLFFDVARHDWATGGISWADKKSSNTAD